MNTILVTGASGFIGSHLCERLIKDGSSVVGIDNFDEYYPRIFKEKNIELLRQEKYFQLIEGDIRNKDLLRRIFSENRVETVVHLAARAGVRPSIENPALYTDVNVTGTVVLLEVMRELGIRNIVFASSSSVYGDRNKAPFTEDEPADSPVSPYAATKRAGELLCFNYYHLYGFHVSCLRFFTAYGPRQRPDMAIHKFVRKILSKEPIQMFGNGSSERDYTYIDDIVSGIVLAVNKHLGFNIFNLGESSQISLKKLISTIEMKLGEKAIIETLPSQPGDVFLTCADISKAKNLLGYHPKTPIDDGLEIFCEWYKKNIPWLMR